MARAGAFHFDWRYKVLVQFVLSHFPKGETINHLLQHANKRWSPENLSRYLGEQIERVLFISKHIQLAGATVVEVGTGWQPSIPLLFYLFGAKHVYTYDHVAHVRFDLTRASVEQLRTLMPSEKLDVLREAKSLDDLLKAANITYIAPGDACSTGLPDHSVDLFFSQEVLEHVPEQVLDGLVKESKRILKSSGIAYHAFEPGDHYTAMGTSRVNFLKYPEWAWKFFVKNKISYHNRLREKDILSVFRKYGGNIGVNNSKVDAKDVALLCNGFKLDSRFRGMTPEELAVWYSEVIYRFQ